MKLPYLSSAEINNRLKELRTKENEAIAEIVLHLSELDRSGDYRDLGYSSLFVYCTSYLGYSEGAAYRRIAAARSSADHPEILDKLRSGVLSLCAVLELSKVVTHDNKKDLIESAEGKSKREVQKLVSEVLPPAQSKVERVVAKRVAIPSSHLFETKTPSSLPPPVAERWDLSLEADKEFMDLYTSVKAQVSSGRMIDVLKIALKHFVRTKLPVEREKRRSVRSIKKETKRVLTRHIPVSVKDGVYLRDKGQCSFCGPDGTRCSEKMGLQIDHIRPWAMGGDHDPENLRLLCASHNRLMAERVFGKDRVRGNPLSIGRAGQIAGGRACEGEPFRPPP